MSHYIALNLAHDLKVGDFQLALRMLAEKGATEDELANARLFVGPNNDLRVECEIANVRTAEQIEAEHKARMEEIERALRAA